MRTARRRLVDFTAYVRETGAVIVSILVTDLSTDGCRFSSAEAFEMETTVWLKIVGVGARRVRIA